MVYSLTDKLEFAENPQIEIKGKKLTINAKADTTMKLLDLYNKEGEMSATFKASEYLFSEKDRKILDSFNLNINDYVKVIQTAMSLCIGEDPDEEKESE